MDFHKIFLRNFFKIKGKRIFFSFNSLISMAGITIGVIALTVSLALFSGYQKVLKEVILGVNSHMYIFKYRNESITNEEFSKIKTILDTTRAIQSYAPFIYTEAMAQYGKKISGIVFRGIDLEMESKTTKFQKFISKGRFISKGKFVVIGENLAKKLNAKTNDTITIISPLNSEMTLAGMIPKRMKVTISGIFSSGMFDYDNTLLYLNMNECQKFLGMPEQFSGIAIRLISEEIENASLHSEILSSKIFFPFQISDWIELNGNLFSLLKLEKWVIFIILALIIVVAGFGLISILTMQIFDNSKQIGILKAMGVRNKDIKRIFLHRNIILGFSGIILGILFGIIFSQILTHTNFVKIESDVYFINKLVVENNWMDFVYIIIFSGLIIWISALIPLQKISKMNAVSIIRGTKK